MAVGRSITANSVVANLLFGQRLAKPSSGGGGSTGDSRWADVLMLVDFTGQDGQTTVTDAKNGEVYTLRGSAVISGGQLVGDGGGWADTPDSPNHDPGESPDTFEFKDVQFDDYVTGYTHGLLSNLDGAIDAITVTYASGYLYFYRRDGITYSFAFTPVVGQKYQIAFSRDDSANLRCFIDGVTHPTVYSGSNPYIVGSTKKMMIGAFNAGDSAFYKLVGRIGAFRLTNGTARMTSDYTPPASFPHG